MRVALYTETFLPKIDGIVRVVCLTLEHLQRHGIEAVVVAPEQGVREYMGARVIGVPCVRNPAYPEGRIALPGPGTYWQVRAFRPDLMHCFHPVMAGLAGLLFAKQLHIPVISSFHLDIATMASFYGFPLLGAVLKKIVNWGFNHSDYALAPSRLVQTTMTAEGINKVGLWRRGVDAEQFHPCHRDPRTRDEISDGHPDDTILIYVGRLAPEKQIEQVRAVLEQVPGTRLALVGGGPYQPVLEKHFAGLPVTFVGYRTGASLARAYASADIFVFPSAFESFGLVILEAMACGIPVVSAQVGGAQDMIEEGVSGYTFEVNDVNKLVAGVRAIVSEPGKLDRMRVDARNQAERQSWPAMMDELFACYEAVLTGQPSPI
jgi:glycosyltransferase involved in cell wall biosynthesis